MLRVSTIERLKVLFVFYSLFLVDQLEIFERFEIAKASSEAITIKHKTKEKKVTVSHSTRQHTEHSTQHTAHSSQLTAHSTQHIRHQTSDIITEAAHNTQHEAHSSTQQHTQNK